MNKKEQIKLIYDAFSALPTMQRGWSEEKKRLCLMNLQSEKQHRSGMTCRGISKDIAARLFTVKHIAESLQKPRLYEVADILSIRNECLYAQALVGLFGKDIRASWKAAGITVEAVLALDYVELMK